MALISSRTPEGESNVCPVCGSVIRVEPSRPPGDAPCPKCGQLLWFAATRIGPERATTFCEVLGQMLGVDARQLAASTSFIEDLGADSLDLVELMMELEEHFQITIPDAEAQRIRTVREALEAMARQLEKA
jgi:acyl carrier protein